MIKPRKGMGVSKAKAVAMPSLPRERVFRYESREDPRQTCLVYLPHASRASTPPFVTVHGLSRNVEEHAFLFAPFCEAHGVVLIAPVFSEEHFADYQRLGRPGRGLRADEALDALLEELVPRTGAEPGPIHLFGFSGGAQFAHRYTMAHPARVAHAVVAAPGWYTFPDREERFPYGVGRSRDLPDLRFDAERFLRVPMTVMVGDQDVTTVDLRTTERVNRQQGLTRLERARNWVTAMQAAARVHRMEPRVVLETLPGGDHVFAALMQGGGLGERVFRVLHGTSTPRLVRTNGA